MPERFCGPGSESGIETREVSPDRLLLEEVRNAARDMLRDPEDILTREIAEKILAKAEIKDRVDELFAHANDVTVYQELKKLGVFVVRDTVATFDYKDETTGFSIHKGDSYLDLHLPPVPQELRSRQAVEWSLDLIAQYIEAQRLNPKYIMGITYERMARLAERQFGFTVAYLSPDSLPDGVMRGIQRVYEGFTQTGMDGREIGLPALVFMETIPSTEVNPGVVHSNLGSLILKNYEE